MENAIECFAIFGGLDVELDCSKTHKQLIFETVLQNFQTISLHVTNLLNNDKDIIKLLRALAIGDRRIFSSFKKARLNNINGGIALEYLQKKNIVTIEYSRETDKRELKPKLSKEEAKHRISDKFLINYPFLRFWFYFVYPHTKEIEQKIYKNFFDDFEKNQHSYTSLVYEELSRILLSYNLRDEIIESIDSYWDANVEIDILVKTKNDHIYIAECKWTNHKINKKELNKLIEKSEIAGFKNVKQFILFSKRGFSKELYNSQNQHLALYTLNDFEFLIHSKPKEMIFPLKFLR